MTSNYKSHVTIDLNSRDRNSGTIENPTFFLSHQIKFSQSPTKSYYMRLENTLIPKTFYDIDSTNNTLLIIENDGTPTTLTYTATPGNYTIIELLTDIETYLDANTGDANAYTLTYDDITNKVTFEVAYGTSTSVTIDTISAGSTLNDLLGFGRTSKNLIDAQISLPDATPTEATYTVDLDTKSYIFVKTGITSANYYNKDIQAHIGAIVPVNVDRNEKLWFENSTGSLTLLNNKGPISKIELELLDEYENQMNLNGGEWSTKLSIYELLELHKV